MFKFALRTLFELRLSFTQLQAKFLLTLKSVYGFSLKA